MDAQLKKRLAVANAAFANAKAAVATRGTGDFYRPEPGRYKVRITDAEINTSQAGRLQCYFELSITEGDAAGQKFRKYYGLDDKGMEFLIGDITRLEREVPDDTERLVETLSEIVKAQVVLKIRVKENGEFLNTYFDGLVKGDDEPATPVAPAAAAPAPAAAAPAPAAPAPEPEGDDIVIGRRLSAEGRGNGSVTTIDEAKGLVTLALDAGGSVTVTVDKLGLPIAPTPAPKTMRVVKPVAA